MKQGLIGALLKKTIVQPVQSTGLLYLQKLQDIQQVRFIN